MILNSILANFSFNGWYTGSAILCLMTGIWFAYKYTQAANAKRLSSQVEKATWGFYKKNKPTLYIMLAFYFVVGSVVVFLLQTH
ncbi:hypothetical protein ASO20_01220 [Mycoplasma sp. (ex Biomphalaria glabrata)]|uniref:hypothetical protein n=1 Tax=Mycoplasma sp. (ex Biomphalaria glabrata) TaxID=1749074 RepID=UPI00073AC534|nr:hypothetical protein [Mycoplasma sp. (ex Biomphalaria glabrata)]ALV23278.1 hypothetical protein ASO20_01220 [Mycoplasma sp. (ex Biomphalaria glabrata)]